MSEVEAGDLIEAEDGVNNGIQQNKRKAHSLPHLRSLQFHERFTFPECLSILHPRSPLSN